MSANTVKTYQKDAIKAAKDLGYGERELSHN